MRVARLVLLSVLTCSAIYAATVPMDSDLLARVKKLEGFVRFTKERTPLDKRIDEGCVRFHYGADNLGGPGHELLAHRIAGIHVYVTEGGFAATKGRQTSFPVGTIVLKQKFPTLDATEPELYAGMLKREKGYNPKAGDLEFFTMNGSATAVTARGRIDSCMDCHQQYATTDFVTKRYVHVLPVRGIPTVPSGAPK